MYDHSTSVFNNNCLKPAQPAQRPKSAQIFYEQKYLNDLHNEVTKNFSDKMKANVLIDEKTDVKEYLSFFDSIPEYDEINHLSSKEFYKKLENLKEQQKSFCECLQKQLKYETKDTAWIDQYKNLQIEDRREPLSKSKIKEKKSSIKPFCATPTPKKTTGLEKSIEDDYMSSSDKEVWTNKPPSRRSVRIETPSDKTSLNVTPEPHFRAKSRFQNVFPETNFNENFDFLMLDDVSKRNTPIPTETRSAPSSPTRTRKPEHLENGLLDELDESGIKDGITIPKPFQMTVRDEENRIVEELFLKINKPKDEKPEQFKAHDVPIESQIPLFEKIMEDQKKRSDMVKQKRKAALQASMKPFSFTRRDEEIQELTKTFSKSLPCIYYEPEEPVKIKKFKAKPIPKNLFSNYIYRKMHEDEFYRALQKKIRAEELLKQASLPPSMAKREKSFPNYDVCPRSLKSLNVNCEVGKESAKKCKKVPNYKAYHDQFERELEALKNEFISTSPRPFKFKSSKKLKKKHSQRNSSACSSKSSCDTRTASSLDMSSINRSNLAAVLRIQSARRRLELDMIRKLEEAKIKEEMRWREKLFRKKPVWQTLAYSHEEDLAMRLQQRRDEERLRNEEHKFRMQMMLGRVYQQPTLFERQSQAKYPTTREELVDQLHREYQATSAKPRSSSAKRSIIDISDNVRPLVEMKDEAIQAMLDDLDDKERRSRKNSKESDEILSEETSHSNSSSNSRKSKSDG